MATTIQIKRGTGSAVPTGLADGELAINLDNGKLYFGSGSTSINSFRFENITAENYIVSSSVTNITTQELSGSTLFGNSADDTHEFTGAITGSTDISSDCLFVGTSFSSGDWASTPSVSNATLTVNPGHLNDDISLRLIYSAADLMVVPSRLEGFGQTGLESHACGTPVAAFNFGGLIDIVDNYNTGILSKPFDADSLANKIEWALKDKKRLLEMGIKARKRAEELWSEERVAGLYVDFYKKILSNNKKFNFSKDT